jgi:ABC-2 type transport system permease protein
MSISNPYHPTFLEKLLGKHYKWWYLIVFAVKSSTAYRLSNYAFLISRFLALGSLLIVWIANIQSGASIFDIQEILTYYILGEIFFFDPSTHYEISYSILYGWITNILLIPIPVLPYYTLLSFGYGFFAKFTRMFIGLILAFFTYQFDLFLIPSSFSNFLIFLVFFVLSFLILNSFSFITGSLAFWMTSVWGTIELLQNIKNITSGTLFPLSIFSWTLYLGFLPFAFTFYHPIQIYLGNYNLKQTLLVLAGGVAWCLLLMLLAQTIFKMGLKKNESVGL